MWFLVGNVVIFVFDSTSLAKGTFQVVVNCNRTFQKNTPLHRIILSTCAVLQDASAPAQFKRAFSGNKNQGEPTFFTLVTRKRARRANEFHRKLKRGVLEAERIRKKIPQKYGLIKVLCNWGICMTFWLKSCYIINLFTSNQSIILGLIWKPFLSRIKTSREFIFRIIWTPIYISWYYKCKEWIRKLHLDSSLTLNLCKSSLRYNCCERSEQRHYFRRFSDHTRFSRR